MKKSKFFTIFVVVVLFAFLVLAAQSDEILSGWNKTIYPGQPSTDFAVFTMLNDSSNNILMVGAAFNGTSPYVNETANDWRIVKYDATGSPVAGWNITYSANTTNAYDDLAYDAALDSAGNLYVTGLISINGQDDFHVKKYNSAGQEQSSWNKTLGWGGSSSVKGTGVTVDSSDNVYVVGTTYDNGVFEWRFSLFKFNSAGTKIFEANMTNSSGSPYTFTGPPSTDPRYVDVVVNGSGHSFVSFFDDSFSGGGWMVQAYTPTGTKIWDKKFEMDSSMPVRMAIRDNDIYAVGSLRNSVSFSDQWMVKKFDTNGVENISHWNITYSDSDGGVYASNLAFGPENSLFVVGTDQNVTAGNRYATGADWRIVRYESDATLNATWTQNHVGPGNGTIGADDVPYAALHIPNSTLYVGGKTQEPSGAFGYINRWWVKKFNATYQGAGAVEPIPEWEDYAALLILVTVVGGFYAMRRQEQE